MRNLTVGRTVAASQERVWAVLADYPNISDWNDGLSDSFAIGEATEGVGAQRQCEMAPKGKVRMRETVTEWRPLERMAVAIDEIEKMPFRQAAMAFTLAPDGDGTAVEMSYDYELKGGPLGMVLVPMLDRQMKKGFGAFIDDLEAAALA